MYRLRTEHDYDYFEAVSALQKSIRRGLELESMYWGLELSATFSKALWTRLRVISVEDVGVANVGAIVLIEALHRQYQDFAKLGREGSARLVLATAILALCRSPKSRESDHFQAVVHQRRLQKAWRLAVPDFAKDQHTAAGHRLGRSWDHWFTQGCELVPESEPNAYQQEAQQLWRTSKKQTTVRPKKKASLFDQPEFDEPAE
jgi:replication-associated recombination protein RarA